MRLASFVLLTLSAGAASAQESSSAPAPIAPAAYRHDVGVFVEHGSSFLSGRLNNYGVQFRRARKKDDLVWFRLGAAYGRHQSTNPSTPVLPPDADTFTQVFRPQSLQFISGIAGLEIQRPLMDNRLFFVAGGEARPFGGWGTQDSSVNTSFLLPGGAYGNSSATYPVRQDTRTLGLTLGLYAGAKAYFERYVLGVDFAVGNTFYNQRTAGSSIGGMDLRGGTIRFSAGYRF